MTCSFGRGPYGQRRLSPKKIIFSFGSCFKASLTTVSPPTPESIKPIGAVFIIK